MGGAQVHGGGRGRGDREVIGVISDTHGLMRPEALQALRGVERIIHAGDVGTGDVLEQLERIAPVTVVRGNVDKDELPLTASVDFGGRKLFVIHIREELRFDPKTAGYAALIFGHTHRALVEERNGVLFLNPGSAGPRRFDLMPSVARLTIRAGKLHAEIVPLRITDTAS